MIYFDHASTTKCYPEVVEKMNECFFHNFGNASSLHGIGRNAMSVVDKARDDIAKLLCAESKEIFFTSGGTEADNWALKGTYFANSGLKNKLVVGANEHHAIIESAKSLSKLGCEVVYVNPDESGVINPEKLESIIDHNTFLVSIMYVNNETGCVNDIKRIAEICRKKQVTFHTDAVQATAIKKLDVKELGMDMMTISAHKIGGPKGIGLLYIKKGTRIAPLVEGGSQELSLRGGTINVPLVAGFGVAMTKSYETIEKRVEKLRLLHDYFESQIKSFGNVVKINGENRIFSISSVTFKGIKATTILTRLDLKGICVSAGSACTAGSVELSNVLLSMGMNEDDALSTVRFSFGEDNTIEEIDKCVAELRKIIDSSKR